MNLNLYNVCCVVKLQWCTTEVSSDTLPVLPHRLVYIDNEPMATLHPSAKHLNTASS